MLVGFGPVLVGLGLRPETGFNRAKRFQRRNGMWGVRSNLFAFVAALGAVPIMQVAAGEPHLGQFSSEHGNLKFEAQISSLNVVKLFRKAGDPSPDTATVMQARGEAVCIPPDFLKDKKALFDPTAYYRAEMFPVFVEVEPAGKEDDVIVVKGIFAVSVDFFRKSTDLSATFLPGALWKVKSSVNIGYRDRQKKTKLQLEPGTYRIGPYGKFMNVAQDEVVAVAQHNGDMVVEGDLLARLVRVSKWEATFDKLPTAAEGAEIASTDKPPPPHSVIWVEPGPREGTVRIITDRARIPVDHIGKLGLMRERLPKLQLLVPKLDLVPSSSDTLKEEVSPILILRSGMVLWGATEGPVELAGKSRYLLRPHVVGKATYQPLLSVGDMLRLSLAYEDKEKKAQFHAEVAKRWPQLRDVSPDELPEFRVKVFELLPLEWRSEDYETEFVTKLRALGAFVALNDSGGVKIVNLSGKVLPNGLMAELGSLTELEWLWLADTNVTDAELANLTPLRMLRRLSLANTRISDEGLKHLSKLTSLRHLDVKSTKVTDAGLKGLQELLPDLQIHK
ncbi:MAG: hypothetical protein NZ602_17150 [Thermoguttaceae bacterium]|nr:hypothetical protein [Thermoguttaceae bacterium]MDW8038988.1 hypothetical protein [Thermoguttaceae bacterium]